MSHFPKINKLPEAVFWDWDGTIANTLKFLEEAHNHTLRSLGKKPFKEGDYASYFGKRRDFIFSTFYGEDQKEAAVKNFEEWVFKMNHLVEPISSVCEVVKYLHEKGVVQGIVTNKLRRYVEKEVCSFGLELCLPIVVCSGEAKEDKPSKEPLLLALEKTGLSLENKDIWYAGDTDSDLLCAQNAGCKTVLIEGHKDTESLIRRYNPYISFDNYDLFHDFLVAI